MHMPFIFKTKKSAILPQNLKNIMLGPVVSDLLKVDVHNLFKKDKLS